MTMTEKACELKKSMDETLDLCKRKLGEEMFDADDVDTEAIKLVRGIFHVCDLAMELTCKQAETIEEINSKLDKLLADK